jgi:homoserine O-succinyltransferase
MTAVPPDAPYKFPASYLQETSPKHSPRVSIGIVNNMPDAAFQTTERQFVTLLQAAAGDCDVRIHLFSLPGVARSNAALQRVRTRYIDYQEICNLHLDGLIVTGASPYAERIEEEPYWQAFEQLVDWARYHTASTIWSCLAAHAAVLSLDGIQRCRLPSKVTGVFDSEVCSDDPFIGGVKSRYRVPHSRYNEVRESDLVAHDYRILSRSGSAGVDMFAKATPSEFLFIQGHPEYDGDTLMREYVRDVTQFVSGEREEPPAVPAGYLSATLAHEFSELAQIARVSRDPDVIVRLPALSSDIPSIGAWSTHAMCLFRSWIVGLLGVKRGTAGGAKKSRRCQSPSGMDL